MAFILTRYGSKAASLSLQKALLAPLSLVFPLSLQGQLSHLNTTPCHIPYEVGGPRIEWLLSLKRLRRNRVQEQLPYENHWVFYKPDRPPPVSGGLHSAHISLKSTVNSMLIACERSIGPQYHSVRGLWHSFYAMVTVAWFHWRSKKKKKKILFSRLF